VQYSHEVIIRERLLASLREQAAQDRAQGVEKIVIRDAKAKLISFEMLSIARFSITANFLLTEELVQLLRHHGGAYDFDAHEWVCGINQYQELLAQIAEICQRPALAGEKPIELDPISKMSLDLLEFTVPFSDKSKKNLIGYDYQDDLGCRPRLTHLPSSLYHSLYSFQKVGVQYGVDHHARIVLGDEMGVGKTIQAISMAYLFQKDWPVLIITPSSLKYSWRDELLTWVEGLRSDQIQVFVKSTEEFDHTASIYIMSYVLATKLAALIDRRKFNFCICDEAHYLKSRDSQRSKYLVPVLMKTKRVLLLSGTPILARPNEIYNLLRILRPDIFYSFKAFGMRYCSPRESYFGVDWTGSSNMRELHLMLERGLMIRRLKSEVLTELPAKRRQRVIIPCDATILKKIGQLLKKVKGWDEESRGAAE
jgi:SWI/SNF-related matrix-associated actin-dependent regulator of chromatin subfamily A-like protein 1